MAYTKKIKAGLVPVNIQEFIGDAGTIFYDPDVGDFHLSDGVTPGGTLLSSSGGNGNGYTGSQGTNGYTGSQGIQGNVGSAGATGASGISGTTGYTGSTGTNGADGATGPTGYTGSTGTNGSNGVTGYTGSIGESGNASIGNWAFVDNTMYNMAGGEINNGDPTHGATAGLILPANGNVGVVSALFNTYGNAQIQVANIANSANTSIWTFGTDGSLTLPGGSWTKTTNNSFSSGVASQVVWTSTQDFISGAKLTIQVEANEPGGLVGWDTQMCEAIVAVRGHNTTSIPVISVYGVTHTSTAPLMTFTVDRNPTTSLIEITGTRTQTATAAGGASLRIYSVETGTND